MRVDDTADVEQTAVPPLALPEDASDSTLFDDCTSAYIDSLEIRGTGDGAVWARPTLPLVGGEDMTPVERTVSVSDTACDADAVRDSEEWRSLSHDLVSRLH